jgi:osmotically inducible protein OsmC
MKPFRRTASVVWEGSHQHGEGAITTQSSTLKNARYVSENHWERGKGTNPSELLAAAHASSFSTALAMNWATRDIALNKLIPLQSSPWNLLPQVGP